MSSAAELLHLQQPHLRQDDEANELADKIMVKIADQVNSFDVYSGGLFEAASPCTHRLLSDQQGVTPGVRIKVGDEPANLYDHIRHSAFACTAFQQWRLRQPPAEPTAERNPAA